MFVYLTLIIDSVSTSTRTIKKMESTSYRYSTSNSTRTIYAYITIMEEESVRSNKYLAKKSQEP